MTQEATHDHAGDFVQSAVASHQAPLLRYAARLLGGDVERARDVVQDVFVKLMDRPVHEVEGHLAEWLFTVCRHRVLDVLRKEGRMKRFGEGEAELVAGDEARPGQALENAEAQDELVKLLGGLPKNQQEVVRLKFQDGFSYKEISRITGHSVSNVGFLIHSAVRCLRAEFAAGQP